MSPLRETSPRAASRCVGLRSMSPLRAATTGATTASASFTSAIGTPNLPVRAPANTICNSAGGKTRPCLPDDLYQRQSLPRDPSCNVDIRHVSSRSSQLSDAADDANGRFAKLFCERGRVGSRRIDPKRVSCHTGHRKAANRSSQRHQTFQPHRLFRSGIGFVAEALSCEKFARHGHASVLARISQAGIPMRVDRVNDSLLNANGERASNLRKPRISSIPVSSDSKIHNLLLSL